MTVKFPNKSYKPKQLLHWCSEESDFDQVLIVGIKDGKVTYHTSSEDFSFLSAVYFMVMTLITRQFSIENFKRPV